MPSIHPERVKIEAEKAKALLEDFADILGDDEDRLVAIESETDVVELIRMLIAQIDEVDTALVGVNSRLQELKSRKDRLSRQKENCKMLITQAMAIADLPKIDVGYATVCKKKTPAKLDIKDESRLPSFYFVTTQTTTLDKYFLCEQLKEDEEFLEAMRNAGACDLVQHETIQIRRK